MSVEARKKKNETFDSLLRRFTTRMVKSGVILEARKRKAYKRPLSSAARKRGALYRKRMTDLREYLRKTGKLEEFEQKRNKKRK